MLEQNNHEPEYLMLIGCLVVSMVAGVAKELSNFETCFNKRRFISNILAAGVFGFCIGFCAPEFEHKSIIMFSAGVAGTLGTSVFNYFGDLLKVIVHHFASKIVGHDITVEDIEKINKIDKHK